MNAMEGKMGLDEPESGLGETYQVDHIVRLYADCLAGCLHHDIGIAVHVHTGRRRAGQNDERDATGEKPPCPGSMPLACERSRVVLRIAATGST